MHLTSIAADDEQTLKSAAIELLLVKIDIAAAGGIGPFLRCRTLNPTVPVIILCEGADPTLAVELVKCGAEDFCELPINPTLFVRKIERALDLIAGTVLPIPLLLPLAQQVRATAANRRRVYRAPCTSANWATVQARTWHGVTTLRVSDVSVPIDDHPGGLGIFVGVDLLNQMPVCDWRNAAPFVLQLIVAGEPGPIDIQATMVGDIRPGPGGRVVVGVQYEVEQPADLTKIRNFWARCQRAHTVIPPDD